MKQRALITGIAGFVGLHLAEHLSVSGDQVLGCDLTGVWPSHAPKSVRENAAIFPWRLGEEAEPNSEYVQMLEEFSPTVVYHLAAVSVPNVCESDVTAAQRVNVDGTQAVLRWAENATPRPRVLFVSTSHVYERPSQTISDATEIRLDEASPVAPTNVYGRTKHEAEQAVFESPLDTIVVRAFQHGGPRQSGPLMLPEWLQQLADPTIDPITVHTTDAWIDFTDVRDVVRAYRLLSEPDIAPGVYNVGSGFPRKTGDILDRLIKITGRTPSIEQIRPGRKFTPIADIGRLIHETGWRPEIPIDQTLQDAWDAFPKQ
jgi:GDP-4-dehydro-6-deoxy-D-mannose reductase